MKKALVFYLYGNRNAGDMAICLGAIEFLKKQGFEITMVSRFSEAEDDYRISKAYILDYYDDVSIYPGPFSFDRRFSPVKKCKSYFFSALKSIGLIRDRQIERLICDADVVFFNGGNLLRGDSLADYMRLRALFYPIKLAHAHGKPLYCLPQSTAHTSRHGEKLLRKYLGLFDKVFVREQLSYDELRTRIPGVPFIRSTDLAFMCEDTPRAKEKYVSMGMDICQHTIGVVVRGTGIGDIGELSAGKRDKLVQTLLSFIGNHREYRYLVVVQTEKDREFSNETVQQIRRYAQAEIVEESDPLVLREIYKRLECLITMRLHAGILSLSAGTPVVGVFSEEWGLKNPGIMRDYDMPYVLIEEAEPCVIPGLPNEQKESIIRKIDEYTKTMQIW